jgi:hypothetical protein
MRVSHTCTKKRAQLPLVLHIWNNQEPEQELLRKPPRMESIYIHTGRQPSAIMAFHLIEVVKKDL